MFKKLLYLVLPLVGFALAACSDISAPTPKQECSGYSQASGYCEKQAPNTPHFDVIAPNPDGTCRSGYSVATGRNGEIICVSDEGSEQSLRVRHIKWTGPKQGASIYKTEAGRAFASGYVNYSGRTTG